MWGTSPSFHAKVWWGKCKMLWCTKIINSVGDVPLGWSLHFLDPPIVLPCPASGTCWNIPWLLIQDFHMRNLLCMGEFVIPYVVLIRCSDTATTWTPKLENWEMSSGALLSCGCYSTAFWSHSAFPEWNSTLSLLSKTCQGSFIFYI